MMSVKQFSAFLQLPLILCVHITFCDVLGVHVLNTLSFNSELSVQGEIHALLSKMWQPS
jgi:hypothetical protein